MTAISGSLRILGAFTEGKTFALEHERFKRELISSAYSDYDNPASVRRFSTSTKSTPGNVLQKTYSRKRTPQTHFRKRTPGNGLQDTYSRKPTPENVLHKCTSGNELQGTCSRKGTPQTYFRKRTPENVLQETYSTNLLQESYSRKRTPGNVLLKPVLPKSHLPSI
jgi:hypothetical protein